MRQEGKQTAEGVVTTVDWANCWCSGDRNSVVIAAAAEDPVPVPALLSLSLLLFMGLPFGTVFSLLKHLPSAFFFCVA